MVDSNLLGLAEGLYPPFNDLLWTMERRGVYVSTDELRRVESEATTSIQQAAASLDTFAGEPKNWNANTSDVAWFLYDHLGLPELPDEARGPKHWGKERITAHEALEYFHRHHPERREEIDTLRQYRRACRARNYATDLLERSRPTEWPGIGTVHPTYGTYNDNSQGKQRDKTGTATGRLSISNPPLQQIPRDKKKDPYRVRRAFVAPPGQRLCVVDLEQLEVRIQAHIHIALFGDTTLRDFCTAGDFHGLIAHHVFSRIWPTFADHVEPRWLPNWKKNLRLKTGWDAVLPDEIKDHYDPKIRWCRDQVKAVFYGLAYGKGEKAFGSTLWTIEGNPIGTETARALMQGIYDKIPAIPKFDGWVEQVVWDKGGMPDLFGVWRPVTKDKRGVRQAKNTPMQGTGARLAALWMLLLRGFEQRLQVHDELLITADEDKAEETVKQVEAAAAEVGEIVGMKCPLKAKGGHGLTWDEGKS